MRQANRHLRPAPRIVVQFRPGYNVFVVGPYHRQNDANAALTVAKGCVPDAYVKYGEYLGE